MGGALVEPTGDRQGRPYVVRKMQWQKRAKHPGIEIGEAVLWRRKPVGGAFGKLSVAWSYSVFLGIQGHSNEFIVPDATGIYNTRTVQRRSIGDRWDVASAEQIRYVPWKVREDDEKADVEVLVAAALTDEEVAD